MQRDIVTNLVIAGGSLTGLFECLLSLEEIAYCASHTMVLDNSHCGVAARVKMGFPGVEVVRPPEPLTFAGAANAGLRRAFAGGSRLVLLLNDDVTVHHETAGLLAAAQRAFGPGLYQCEIWPYEPGLPRERWRLDWHKRLVVREAAEPAGDARPIPLDYAEASAVMVSSEVFEATGGFDEDLGFYFEDADLSVRAQEAGYPVMEVPDARVWHKMSLSAGRGLSPFKAYYRARNTLRFACKHPRRASRARNAIHHFGEFVLPATFEALAGTPLEGRRSQVIAAIMRGTADSLTGWQRPPRAPVEGPRRA